MDDLHGGVRGVHPLSALTGGATNIHFDLVRFDHDIHLFRFRQHGDRGSAGVDAALRFSRRHALNAMHATLIFETLVDVLSVDLKNDFAKAAEIG